MAPPFKVGYYARGAGRSPVQTFLEELPPRDAAFIVADIATYARLGRGAPVLTKKIRGHRGLFEIVTLGFRTFFTVRNETIWVLHACKKQDQVNGINLAAKRLREIEEDD